RAALQYSRARPERFRRFAQAPACDLCVGDDRAVAHRSDASRVDPGAVLASDAMELALSLGSTPGEIALPLLVVILGPTASGKTALSLALAESLAKKSAGESHGDRRTAACADRGRRHWTLSARSSGRTFRRSGALGGIARAAAGARICARIRLPAPNSEAPRSR